MEGSPVSIRRRLQLGHPLRRDLPIKLVQASPVAASHLTRALGGLRQPSFRLVRIDHHLGGVLTKAAEAEHGQQGIAVRQADEQPLGTALERLVAKVLDQRRRHIVGRPIDHLQVEHLQHLCARKLQAPLAPGRLHVADHLAAVLGHVDEGLLREGQERRQRGAEQRPQPRSRRLGSVHHHIRRPVHLLDAREVEQSRRPQLQLVHHPGIVLPVDRAPPSATFRCGALVLAIRTNSSCRRLSPVSSG